MRCHRVVDSPIGALTLTWDDAAGVLRGLHVHDQTSSGVAITGQGVDPAPAVSSLGDVDVAAIT